jgi:hypothetical protein
MKPFLNLCIRLCGLLVLGQLSFRKRSTFTSRLCAQYRNYTQKRSKRSRHKENAVLR